MKSLGSLLILVVFGCGLVFLAGAIGQDDVISEFEKELWALEEAYISSFKAANHEAILAVYHDNFLGWPEENSAPAGKEGAELYLKTNYPEPATWNYKIEKMGIKVTGNVALTHYLVHFYEGEGDSQQTVTSRITHTWIREGGTWKILGGMSNRQ
jgi:ketosteroid isomerase-like protein